MKNHPAEFKSPKILFVDDNEDHLFLIKEKNKNRGSKFDVFLERNGEKIFEKIKKKSIDLILLDYDLSGNLNGLQILKKLRDFGVKCPIIMLSGQGNEKIASEAIKSGAQEYFCKNSEDIDDLFYLIESFFLH